MDKISKIQFRQDTTANWETINPVLAPGEPAYNITSGTLKLGNGSTNYSELPELIPATGGIQDVEADGKLYARTRGIGAIGGSWEDVDHIKRKTLADLLAQPYNTKLNMGYSVTGFDNVTRTVYGLRFYNTKSNAVAGVKDSETIISNISSIIDCKVSVNSDTDHNYIIPTHVVAGSNIFTGDIHVDIETHSIVITSTSTEARDLRVIDGWVLFTEIA